MTNLLPEYEEYRREAENDSGEGSATNEERLLELWERVMSTKTEVRSSPFPRKRHYTVPELCDVLGKSHHTLQRWRSEGYGPEYEKCGNTIYYDADVVEAWRKSTARASTSANSGPTLVVVDEEQEGDD